MKLFQHRSLTSPKRIAVLSVTDLQTAPEFSNGERLTYRLVNAGHSLAALRFVTNSDEIIQAQVQEWIDGGEVDLIFATDDSFATAGDIPPSVILLKGDDELEEFTTFFRDSTLGYVEIVDLALARSFLRAA